MRATKYILQKIEEFKNVTIKDNIASDHPILSETESELLYILEMLATQVERLDREAEHYKTEMNTLNNRTVSLVRF